MVGDDVEVRIVEIKGEHVKLGITAPREIPVHRKEIFEAIKRENIKAAQSKVKDLGEANNLIKKKEEQNQSAPRPDKKPPKGASPEE